MKIDELVVATGNANKVREIRQVFSDSGIRIIAASERGGMPDVVEDGETFVENATKKALAGAAAFGCCVLADDSGLMVDALGGAPGVYSARYAGEGGNDGRNVAKLLANLRGENNRIARFVCSMVVASPDGNIIAAAEGCVEGKIAEFPQGNGGFGYDPVFIPDGYDSTFGVLSADIKNSISHRGNAIRSLREKLLNNSNNQ